jgi:hypothetical protein
LPNYARKNGLDLDAVVKLPRPERRTLLAEPIEAITSFIWLLRKEMPECIRLEQARAIAFQHFTCRDPDAALADEAGVPRHRLPYIRVLVRAIIHYMKDKGIIHLHNNHYYWPEYDYINRPYTDTRRGRNRRAVEEDDPDNDAPDDLEPYDGPVIQVRPPAPDNRSGKPLKKV